LTPACDQVSGSGTETQHDCTQLPFPLLLLLVLLLLLLLLSHRPRSNHL
jgi:hypothetical protein